MDFTLEPELVAELKNLGFDEDYIMTLTDIAAAGGDIDELVKDLVASKAEEEEDGCEDYGSFSHISPRLGCASSKMFTLDEDELEEFASLLKEVPDDEEDISGMLGEDEEEGDYLKESERGSVTGEYGKAYSCTCDDGIHVYF